MIVATTRFGNIEIPESSVYSFPEGILGFGPIKLYFIMNNPKGGPFRWLQAVEAANLAFVVCEPQMFKPDYKVRVRPEDLAGIELEKIEDGFVMVILTVPADPKEMTANLLGPIIFNPKSMKAKQIVLNEPGYTTKYRIFQQPSAAGKQPESK
jgi:flagellar assembly factor FliW